MNSTSNPWLMTGSGTQVQVLLATDLGIVPTGWFSIQTPPLNQLGEEHDPETHLIPLVLFAAMGRRSDVKLFGQDYPTPDGTCIRDYVHVSDLADAHVAAVAWLSDGKPSGAFNLGNARGFSVAEVVKAAEKVTDRPVRAEMRARRPGDPPVLVSDSAKARRLLDWAPKFPDLEDQIRHAWAWFAKCSS
jgi:UDP-glucose 4-epimerase